MTTNSNNGADTFAADLANLESEQFKDGVANPVKAEGEDADDNEEVREPSGLQVKDVPDEDENPAREDDDEDAEEGEDDEDADKEDEDGEDDEEEGKDKKPLSQTAKLTRALREVRRELAEIKRARSEEAVQAAAPRNPDGSIKSLDQLAKERMAADKDAPKKPDPAAYKLGEFDSAYRDAYDDYLDARREYLANAKEEISKGTSSAPDAAPDVQEFRQQLDATIASGKERFKDFDEKVVKSAEKGEWALTEIGARFIVDSEIGPEIAYHLASNPKLAKEIADLSPLRQAARLGKIEDKLIADREAQKKAAKRPSNAPAPIGSNRGAGGKKTAAFDSEDFETVERSWNSTNKKRAS